ncbi:MAG: PGPGW domain-containing protein [Bacteroidota bacterium]
MKLRSGGRIQRLLLVAVGVVVIVLGIFLLFLPGPGLLLLLAGLWILGREYRWPLELSRALREKTRRKSRAAGKRSTV